MDYNKEKALEETMEESKKEILAQLYALRAGMSYVSELKDDYDICAQCYADNVKEIEDKAGIEIFDEISQCSDVADRLDQAVKTVEQRRRHAETERDRVEKQTKDVLAEVNSKYAKAVKHDKKWNNFDRALKIIGIIGLILLILTLLVSIAYGIYGIVVGWSEESPLWRGREVADSIMITSAIVTGCVLVGGFILLILYPRLCENISYYLFRSGTTTHELDCIAEKAKEKRKNAQDRYSDALQIEKEVGELSKRAAKAAEEYSKENYLRKAAEADNAFVSDYSGLLDKRDWQYLDLVIFYYETGRADTIKEALQLVDNERRNAEVISTIQHASDTICGTINTSIRALGSAMTACFDRLSSQINAGFAALSDSIGAVNAQLGQISAQNAALITGQQMQNALMAKASTSSTQLAKDVSYMTTLADQAEVRRRNGQ